MLLGLQKVKQTPQRSLIPSPPLVSPAASVPHPCAASVQVICYNSWTSIDTLRSLLCVVLAMGFDKSTARRIHCYSVAQNSLLPWKSPAIYLSLLSLLPVTPHSRPWQPLTFLPLPQFCLFRNVMPLESYSVWPFQMGFFHVVTRV